MKHSRLKTLYDWHNLLQAAENGNADAQLEVAIQYGSGIVINGAATAESDEKLEYEWANERGKTVVLKRVRCMLST